MPFSNRPLVVDGVRNIVATNVHIHVFPALQASGPISRWRAWLAAALGGLDGFLLGIGHKHRIVTAIECMLLFVALWYVLRGGRRHESQNDEPAPAGSVSDSTEGREAASTTTTTAGDTTPGRRQRLQQRGQLGRHRPRDDAANQGASHSR
jgi:hypothetical protein